MAAAANDWVNAITDDIDPEEALSHVWGSQDAAADRGSRRHVSEAQLKAMNDELLRTHAAMQEQAREKRQRIKDFDRKIEEKRQRVYDVSAAAAASQVLQL